MKPAPRQLGHELREGSGDFLWNRRAAASLTLVAMAALGVVALYQLGILRRLPEPQLDGLDAEKVNGSAGAYRLLRTPDAVLGLGSYAATLGLAAMGGVGREGRAGHASGGGPNAEILGQLSRVQPI
jgi:hypothetical protein